MLRTPWSVVALVTVLYLVLFGAPAAAEPRRDPSPVITTPVVLATRVEPVDPIDYYWPETRLTVQAATSSSAPSYESPKREAPAIVTAARAPECPAGAGPYVTSAQMAQWAASYRWGPYSPAQMGALFTRESGGCVGIVSPTNDHGCTQMHWSPETAARWDFARIRADCAYAIEAAAALYASREADGLVGIQAWVAGRGWLW